MVRLDISILPRLPDTNAIRCLGALLLMFAVAGCAEPFIVLPGKALSGEQTPPPEDWSKYADVEVVQLETRPEDPYSVNIWAVAVGPDYYIATGEDGTRWTENLTADPRVRLRVESNLYQLRTVRVLDPAEIDRVAAQYSKKYGLDAEDNWVEKALVYRLEPR
ncbi:MAG: hypothetical protein R3E82_19565 [Pseudomonadales bacterium]|nr:hypothetical protein [Pseudomonadales bacterium]